MTPVPSTLLEGKQSHSQLGPGRGYHLVVMGPSVFEVVPLPSGGQVIVGRGKGVDVPLAEPRASRRHLRVRVGERIEIEDLGSANGTRLRGRKLEPRKVVAISAGEGITIGSLVLMVQADRPPTPPRSGPGLPPGPRDADSDGSEEVSPDAVTCVEESMRRLYALAARAAAGTIGVVILGETGVGKEVLARAIHETSARAAKPLVSVNCAALSASLLESELFGYERGAFTGAAQTKPGLLETAPGGTIFLDEVGDLPLALQAKLLRVIEAREVVRVGGVAARPIDVRFVAATNRDLEADVAGGTFRRDLYFRLNGMTLTVPPLRERPRDVPLLARGFVKALARRAGHRRPPEITTEALAILSRHDWPGNVRELRNVIERALLLCEGDAIGAAHLSLEGAGRARNVIPESIPTATTAPPTPPPPPASEQARILAALARCGGNQSRAAKMLGISRKVLMARLDAYGVARPRKPARG